MVPDCAIACKQRTKNKISDDKKMRDVGKYEKKIKKIDDTVPAAGLTTSRSTRVKQCGGEPAVHCTEVILLRLSKLMVS